MGRQISGRVLGAEGWPLEWSIAIGAASDGYYDGIAAHVQAGPDAKVLANWLKEGARERSGARPGSAVWNVIPDDLDSKTQALLVATYGWNEKEVHVSIVDVESGKIHKGVSLNTVDLLESDDVDPADQIDDMLKAAVVVAHIESEES